MSGKRKNVACTQVIDEKKLTYAILPYWFKDQVDDQSHPYADSKDDLVFGLSLREAEAEAEGTEGGHRDGKD